MHVDPPTSSAVLSKEFDGIVKRIDYLAAHVTSSGLNDNPIQNLCFEIKNWNSRTAKAGLKINRVSLGSGPKFRQGINIDTDGSYTMIIWVGLSANSPQSFEIVKE